MNTVNIVGRLVADPELQHVGANDTALAKMRVAVDRAGNKEGDEIKAGFFDVSAWGRLAEVCAQYLAKGRQVAITAELRHETWQNNEGENRSKVTLNATGVTFIGNRADSGQGGDSAPPAEADEDIPFAPTAYDNVL